MSTHGLYPDLSAHVPAAGRTQIEHDGVAFGAASVTQAGPIGGGPGYPGILRGGDVTVTSEDELLEALAQARAGQVVYLADELVLDLTPRVVAEGLVLELPAGVTLAGNRGMGAAVGPALVSRHAGTRPLIRVAGPDARITGIRLIGSEPTAQLTHHDRAFRQDGGSRGHDYYYRYPVSQGVEVTGERVTLDNCELTAWSHSGVYLRAGTGNRIACNYIHHCQYNGLGYGVCHDQAGSLIEGNVFNFNRHSIAGTGAPGSGYEARHNVELGASLSHCFDMHGGRDRKDGTDIAGGWMHVHHNTFRAPKTALRIRGLPEQEAKVDHNWFVSQTEQAVDSPGRTAVAVNAWGPEDEVEVR